MFLVGLAPALVAFVVRRALDEPQIFVKKHAVGKENSLGLLFKDRRTIRTTVGIGIMCSVFNLGYYSLMTWLPSYLAASLGFSLTRAGLWTAVTVLGMAVGIWTFGQLADRLGRKPVFVLFQIAAMIMVFVYSHITDPTTLLWAGAIMGFCVNGQLGGLGALNSEAYPTAARATAQNVLFNFGRAMGGLGPLIIGGLAARYSFRTAISLLASIYALEVVTTIVFIPELKGRELE
jgi:MFS family permease